MRHSGVANQRGKLTMKTISFALVSAGLLALTACGGGNKANNSTTTTNTTGTTEIGNTSTLPPADLGTTNGTGTLGGEGNLSANTTLGNTSANTSGGAGNNSTTKAP